MDEELFLNPLHKEITAIAYMALALSGEDLSQEIEDLIDDVVIRYTTGSGESSE